MKTNTLAMCAALAVLAVGAGCVPVETEWYFDNDLDGVGDSSIVESAVDAPVGYVDIDGDCDDSDDTAFPGNSEVYDQIDNDCNGTIDDNFVAWYPDVDIDNFGDESADPQWAVNQPEGKVLDNTDCNENSDLAFPGNVEIADGIDNNCDGQVDEDFIAYYLDADEDGYGVPDSSIVSDVDPGVGYSLNSNDCDDTTAAINPGASEDNTVYADNNCDDLPTSAPYVVGDYGPAGGIVFHTDGTTGMEAAPEDQNYEFGAEWGCYGTDITAARATAIGAGVLNTGHIRSLNCSPYSSGKLLAVNLVSSYSLNSFDDWFLPSKDELFALYAAKDVVGGFVSYSYWSSSEYNAIYAWKMHFNGGNVSYDNKYRICAVRAVRAF